MSKHTPGPWTAAMSNSDTCDWEVVSDRDVIAGEYGIESVDDAHLIAAAPDLLAALLAAVDCGMVPISSAREGGATAFSEQARVADQIRDAIAKAEGRQ